MRSSKAFNRAAAAIRGNPRLAITAFVVLGLGFAGLGWLGARAIHARLAASAHRDAATITQLGPAPRPVTTITFSDGCTTSRCHNNLTESPVVHAPVARGACDTCHSADTGNHTYPVRRTKTDLCTDCHTATGHQQFVHPAMQGDGCLACHNPHASTGRSLLVAESAQQTCIRCHPGVVGSQQHAPYKAGSCDSCHDPHGADNPSLLLGGAGDENCKLCHAATVTAVQSDQHRNLKCACLACHAPHASDQKGLMIAATRSVCTSCHADVGRTVTGATVSHDPVLQGQQCITCHDPHASGKPNMLRDSQAAVCLSCHDKPLQAASGRRIAALDKSLATSPLTHGAIRDGNCSDCHSVHGGGNEHLLRVADSQLFVGPYDTNNYALCFACHDPNLVQSKSITRFRDGDRNLHEVHLRPGDHPRSCAACHAVHASELPRLIAKTVNFEGSQWAMPIGFTVTADGGRCASACHEPLSYSRQPGGVRGVNNGGTP